MSPGSVLAFWIVAAVLIAVPGPDWAFAIGAGLRRQVGPAAGGIVLGYVAMTGFVATGLGLVLASIPVGLTVLTIVGSGYLMWLGARTARHLPTNPSTSAAPPVQAGRLTVLQGMAVSGLNPKGLLIFVALLPQFADPHDGWPVPVQLAVLGLAFSITCGAVAWMVGAAAHRLLMARPRPARVVARLSGLSMIVFGVTLLVRPLLG